VPLAPHATPAEFEELIVQRGRVARDNFQRVAMQDDILLAHVLGKLKQSGLGPCLGQSLSASHIEVADIRREPIRKQCDEVHCLCFIVTASQTSASCIVGALPCKLSMVSSLDDNASFCDGLCPSMSG